MEHSSMAPKFSRPMVLATTLLLLAVLHSVSSFHVSPRVLSFETLPRRTEYNWPQSEPLKSLNRVKTPYKYRNNLRIWSSYPGGTNDPDSNDEQETPSSETHDGLYEFLTRRTGEQAGESERRRKRDRIREWMGSSSTNGGSMVQPIRMEDGSIIEEANPPRIQARFEQLFSGMPTMDEILNRDDTAADGADSSAEEDRTRSNHSKAVTDDSWFDEEKNKIQGEYQQILQDMKSQMEEQRREDPESIPENADGVAESVVQQELKRMLASVKTTRAEERLQEYETSKRADLDSKDMTGATDAVVERILKEAASDRQRRDALQAEVDDFERYAKEAVINRASDSNVPRPEKNLDTWALERLENMLEISEQSGSVDNLAVTDILEQQIDDLRERIEKDSMKGTMQPQTMKEWQMYRAIATRLGREAGSDPDGDPILNFKQLDEKQVTKQLNSWREYIGKEDDIRKRSGLSVGPRMPFDWQKAGRNPDEDALPVLTTYPASEPKTRKEVRREVNIQAIKALEDLVEKSDSARAENLKKQLDALKAELEPRDYNDIEEEPLPQEAKVGPVDLSGVFSKKDKADEILPSTLYQEEQKAIEEVLSSDEKFSFFQSDVEDAPTPLAPPIFSEESARTSQVPPTTPFFSDDFAEAKAPPPNTPFFTNSNDIEVPVADIDLENTKLGSVDDQKLLNMYRKAGARTKEEQDAIREQWEAFQALEKAKRDASGLFDDAESTLMDKADLKYNMADVLKGDGDFDAEKILAAIGPRPTRKKKPAPSGSLNAASTRELPKDSSDETPKSDLDPAEVSESLYRTISAIGGGRTKDDPAATEDQKAVFAEYLQKENMMRQSLDAFDADAENLVLDTEASLDDPNYAQDVLASIGPRPVFKKKRRDVTDEKELSDRGGILASDDDDEDDDSFDDDEDSVAPSVGPVPSWLQKERKSMQNQDGYDDSGGGLSGRNIDEVFDDDKYEHNLRQLHEYEQRRSGRQKQMGIDISDVFGGRVTSSDDYADYSYDDNYFRDRGGSWGAVSFDARKASLLEYVELSTPELNNLMDHRESVYSTGVSQYLPRINKPFKEFGAIFRLEGVLVDLIGLHQSVWPKVASEFGFRQPILEDIRRASVVRPDIAIRDVFFWTSDIFELRKVTSSFRRVFREQFDEWAANNGVQRLSAPKGSSDKGSMTLGAEEFSSYDAPIQPAQSNTPTPPRFETEQSRLKHLQEAWLETAKELDVTAPTNEQITQSSFLPPEIAVREVFRWTAKPEEIDAVVSVFAAIFSGADQKPSVLNDTPRTTLSEGEVLEFQYHAWAKVAERGSYMPPTAEEVLAASVLNDPEAVIVGGFGWTEDSSLAHSLASQYQEYLAELINIQVHDRPFDAAALPQESPKEVDVPRVRSGPTVEEILAAQVEAWAETSHSHSFGAPSTGQIQLTMNLSAGDAVRQLLGWTHNFNQEQITQISQTYETAFKRASGKFMKAYNIQVTEVAPPPRPTPSTQGKELNDDQVYQAAFDAWTDVAWKSGLSLPDQEQVQFAMSVGPEEAIMAGFRWADDRTNATMIAEKYREKINLKRTEWKNSGYSLSSGNADDVTKDSKLPMVSIVPDVGDWIKSLQAVEMACGVTSYLEEDQMNILLEYIGLESLLPDDKRVSMTNGYDRDSQQMLGVALRIERRPDHCVSFDGSPAASDAAHEVEMQSVSMVGAYPRYELLSADTSAMSLDELTAMNIRRLFGERTYDQPMLDMLQNQPEVRRKTKTAFWDPDE